jgi:hypothetical protein
MKDAVHQGDHLQAHKLVGLLDHLEQLYSYLSFLHEVLLPYMRYLQTNFHML